MASRFMCWLLRAVSVLGPVRGEPPSLRMCPLVLTVLIRDYSTPNENLH